MRAGHTGGAGSQHGKSSRGLPCSSNGYMNLAVFATEERLEKRKI